MKVHPMSRPGPWSPIDPQTHASVRPTSITPLATSNSIESAVSSPLTSSQYRNNSPTSPTYTANQPMVGILSDTLKISLTGDKSHLVTCSVRLTERYLSVRLKDPYNRKKHQDLGKLNGEDPIDVTSLISDEEVFSLSTSDIIGAKVDSTPYNKKAKEPDSMVFMAVYSYPYKIHSKLSFNRSKKRVRKAIIFGMDRFNTKMANQEVASLWVRALMWLKEDRTKIIPPFTPFLERGYSMTSSCATPSSIMDEQEIDPQSPERSCVDGPFSPNFRMKSNSISNIPICIPNQPPKPRKLLVFVNPASGPGRAGTIYKDIVAPLLAEGCVHPTVFVTSSAGSAKNFIARENFHLEYDGVVIISGDGLIFEYFNGLMQRPDWQDVIQLPVGVVPGGSGNGLAHSINYAVGEFPMNPVLTSTLNVIHGKRSPMDLVQVSSRKKTYYSFLSIGWGLLADVDIESERLRLLGGMRFTVWAIVRTMSLKKYHGKLSFLPVTGYYKNSNPFDGKNTYPEMNEEVKKSESLNCPFLDNKLVELPSLDEPVPSQWVSVEGEFVMVYTAHCTHISDDCFFAPNARLDDGVIWLLYIMSNITKTQLLQFLVAMSSGKHIDFPFITFVPVRAFRLEPTSPDGRITIDGELVECEPIQCRVLPAIANVMTR